MRTQPSTQLTAPLLRRFLWLAVALAWLPFAAMPAVAAVMGVHVLEEPLNLPPVLVGLAMVISSLAGMTALLARIDRELSAAPTVPLMRPWLMCASHMSGAWCAGLAAFIMARQFDLSVWPTLGLVLVGSFLGVRFLEMAIEHFLPAPLSSRRASQSDPQS